MCCRLLALQVRPADSRGTARSTPSSSARFILLSPRSQLSPLCRCPCPFCLFFHRQPPSHSHSAAIPCTRSPLRLVHIITPSVLDLTLPFASPCSVSSTRFPTHLSTPQGVLTLPLSLPSFSLRSLPPKWRTSLFSCSSHPARAKSYECRAAALIALVASRLALHPVPALSQHVSSRPAQCFVGPYIHPFHICSS